jgi:hypothetical protein
VRLRSQVSEPGALRGPRACRRFSHSSSPLRPPPPPRPTRQGPEAAVLTHLAFTRSLELAHDPGLSLAHLHRVDGGVRRLHVQHHLKDQRWETCARRPPCLYERPRARPSQGPACAHALRRPMARETPVGVGEDGLAAHALRSLPSVRQPVSSLREVVVVMSKRESARLFVCDHGGRAQVPSHTSRHVAVSREQHGHKRARRVGSGC